MSPHAMSASSSFLSWSFPSRAGVGHCAWSNAALVYRRCTCKGIDESAPRSTLAERPSHVQDYSALRFSLVAEYSGDCTERRKSACSLILVGSRTGRSSRSIAAPRVLRVITLSRCVPYPAKVSATDRRGEPFCWTGPSLLSSSLGPASIAPAFYV